MTSTAQRLAVSALVAANESLLDCGRLTACEQTAIRRLLASVREAFDGPRLPTLIIADPDFDEIVDRAACENTAVLRAGRAS